MRDMTRYEDDYTNQPYERFQVRFRKRLIHEMLRRYPHQGILEIGCGLEPLFLEFTDFESMVVVEPGPKFFSNAQEELSGNPSCRRVEILLATLEGSLPLLLGRQFDVIILSSLLHEVNRPEELLSQVGTLAGPETVVHVNVPNARSFHRLLAFECGLITNPHALSASNIQFQQHSVFDLQGLTQLALRCGFSVLGSGSYAFKPFTHQQMENLVQAGIVTEPVIDGLYAMEKYAPGCGSEIFVDLQKIKT